MKLLNPSITVMTVRRVLGRTTGKVANGLPSTVSALWKTSSEFIQNSHGPSGTPAIIVSRVNSLLNTASTPRSISVIAVAVGGCVIDAAAPKAIHREEVQ